MVEASRTDIACMRSTGITVVLLVPLVFCAEVLCQSSEKPFDPLVLPTLVRMELSQQLNPWDRGEKLTTDRFKFSAGTDRFSMNFSNQSPEALGGKKFLALPRGYRLFDFTAKRGWGSLHGFRTTGYDPRLLKAGYSRALSGAVLSVPKFLGSSPLSAYFLRASAPTLSNSNPGAAAPGGGGQYGVSFARDFSNGIQLLSEYSYSRRLENPRARNVQSGQALFIKMSGTLAETRADLTYSSQDRAFSNPAVNVGAGGKDQLNLSMSRKFRRHQLQYSSRIARSSGVAEVPPALAEARQESLIWTFAPKVWPRISALKSWSRVSSRKKQEIEDSLTLAASKGTKHMSLALAYGRVHRKRSAAPEPLWERSSISGDASLRIPNGRELEIHYETSRTAVPISSQRVSGRNLRVKTKITFFEKNFSLLPAMNYTTCRDNGMTERTLVHFTLSTLVKLPHYLPGTDIAVNFASSHLHTPGEDPRNTRRFVVRWNFKPI